MRIRDFFPKKEKPPQTPFWGHNRDFSISLVHNSLAFIRKSYSFVPYFDWGKKKYLELIEPSTLDKVLVKAAKKLEKSKHDPSVYPEFVTIKGDWYIVCSVFPSHFDRDFLSHCPNGRYQNLAIKVRRSFRKEKRQWYKYHFAHWIFLLHEPSISGSIHLDTFWSFDQRNKWFKEESGYSMKEISKMDLDARLQSRGEQVRLVSGPIIHPVDLQRDTRYRMEQFFEDGEYYRTS